MNINKTDADVKKRQIKIAVLGSGFGAIQTLIELRKIRRHAPKNFAIHITLFSRTDYFWLVTMAHEIATGNLMPADVKQPLRSMPISFFDDYIQSEITAVDVDKKAVKFKLLETVEDSLDTEVERSMEFDYVVSALGSQTHYFGVAGAAEHSLALKTLGDVVKIKNRIIQSFEDAERISDVAEITKLLSFIIVGGGATGVELAGELADLINIDMHKRFPLVAKYSSITIVQGGDKIGIPGMGWMTEELEVILREKHCVNIICNSFVTEVSTEGIKIGDKELSTGTVIWSGGVQASQVEFKSSSEIVRNKMNQIAVAADLSLAANKDVFVVGDQAEVMNVDGKPYPMRAQFAVRQGQQTAHNIMNDLHGEPRKDFSYNDKGVIVSLGNGQALAEVFGRRMKGRLAHLLYKIIYIPQIVGVRGKVKTVVDWTLNMISPRDLSKL